MVRHALPDLLAARCVLTHILVPASVPSIEQSVKAQYAKVFATADWPLFKRMADALFREAAFIKTKDMRFAPSEKLLARNARKRLLIGVGTELLLKAIYLKRGFGINKALNGTANPSFPFALRDADASTLDRTDTFTLAKIIDHLPKVLTLTASERIVKGLRIAKVFRNKEGHVVVASHKFDAKNYREIEDALVLLYRQAFGEVLTARLSLEPNEPAIWRISSPNRAVRADARKSSARR